MKPAMDLTYFKLVGYLVYIVTLSNIYTIFFKVKVTFLRKHSEQTEHLSSDMSAKRNFLLLLFIFQFCQDVQMAVLSFTKEDAFPPVVFVPGDGGSVVEAKLNRTKSSNPNCPKQRDWYRVWLNLEELLPSNLPCQVEVLRLLFNGKTNTSYSDTGIETRFPGFGTAHSIEYIDDSWEAYILDNIGAYAHALIKELTNYGLVRDKSIRGAPYDFRIAMASQKTYFNRLRVLVENTYNDNGNSRVVLMAHSMGGLYTTWFLNRQSQAWKDKYVDCFISLSTPWGGSSESLQAIVSGFTFHHSIILDPLVARKEQRTWESNFLLLPNKKALPNNEKLILTDHKNFTADRETVIQLFNDIGVPTDIYQYVRDANDPRNVTGVMPPHPGVDVFCVYGTKVPTNHIFDFRGKKFPDEQPTMITTLGDGTVSDASLAACKEWNLGAGIVPVPSATHNGLMQEKEGINTVIQIMQSRQFLH